MDNILKCFKTGNTGALSRCFRQRGLEENHFGTKENSLLDFQRSRVLSLNPGRRCPHFHPQQRTHRRCRRNGPGAENFNRQKLIHQLPCPRSSSKNIV
jgi:hypothetical protein